MESTTSSPTNPAGFWIRLGGYIIDSIILLAITYVACRAIGFPTWLDILNANASTSGTTEPAALPPGTWETIALTAVLGTFYHAAFESSKWQATVGKKVLGLEVTDMNEDRINFLRAVGRYLTKFIIITVFPLAMALVGVNSRKRGIHDSIAGTMVLGRNGHT